MLRKTLAAALCAASVSACSSGWDDIGVGDVLDTGIEVLNVGLTLTNAALGGYNAGSALGASLRGNQGTRPWNPGVSVPASPAASTSDPAGCQKLLSLAQECRRRQASLGGGTTGQAGAFDQCARNYEGAYAASCR